MFLNDHEIFFNSNNIELQNNLCNNFDFYCFTAIMFAKRNSNVKFRYALNKVFAFVENIFQIEHSRILICFFEVFIYLIQIEKSNVAFLLQKFIKNMFAKIIMKKHF